jgi:hypothetical protein
MYKMGRHAAIVILLLLTSCRFYDTGKRFAAAAVLQSVVHLQARAPLTQSVARRPAEPAHSRACRLIASPKLLRRNAKRTVELCRSVFPGHNFRQLHKSVFVIQFTEARKKLVGYITTRHADRVCKFKYGPFFS